MSAVIEARTAMRQLAAKAQEVANDRRLSTAQKTAQLDRIEADIKTQQGTIAMHKQNAWMMSGGDSRFASNDDMGLVDVGHRRGLTAGLVSQGFVPIAAPQIDLTPDSAKALHEAALSHQSLSVTTKATDSISIAPSTIPYYSLPPVTARREPTRVLSLLPTVATQQPSVVWYSTTGTAAAAAVAEGGVKPTSSIAYTANTGQVTKLAHVAEVTDETLQDFPAFLSVLQSDMSAGLFKAENSELLNATVAGASKFAGMLNTTGILTLARTAETDLDIIATGFDSLRVGTSFAEPDGIIMHPTTWGIIRRSKDSTGQYLLAADPSQSWNPSIFGVPVVLTTQIAAGTVLVGDFAGSVAVYVRDGLRIETANQGSTQFASNTTLVRAEERLLLTVPRPSGLIKITNVN